MNHSGARRPRGLIVNVCAVVTRPISLAFVALAVCVPVDKTRAARSFFSAEGRFPPMPRGMLPRHVGSYEKLTAVSAAVPRRQVRGPEVQAGSSSSTSNLAWSYCPPRPTNAQRGRRNGSTSTPRLPTSSAFWRRCRAPSDSFGFEGSRSSSQLERASRGSSTPTPGDGG
jgi:hypothetical protein